MAQPTPFDPTKGQEIRASVDPHSIQPVKSYKSDTEYHLYPPNLFEGQISEIDVICQSCSSKKVTQMIESYPIKSFPSASIQDPTSFTPTDINTIFVENYKGQIVFQNNTGLFKLDNQDVKKLQDFQQYLPSHSSYNFQLKNCPLLYTDVTTKHLVSVCYYITYTSFVKNEKQAQFILYSYDVDENKAITVKQLDAPFADIYQAEYINGFVVFFFRDNKHIYNVDLIAVNDLSLRNVGTEGLGVTEYEPQSDSDKDSHVFNLNITANNEKDIQYFGLQTHYKDDLFFTFYQIYLKNGEQRMTDHFEYKLSWKEIIGKLNLDPNQNLEYVQAFPVYEASHDVDRQTFTVPYLLITNQASVRFDLIIEIKILMLSYQVRCPYYHFGSFQPFYGGNAYKDIVAVPYALVDENNTLHIAFGIYQSTNPKFGGSGSTQPICADKDHGVQIISNKYLQNYTFDMNKNVFVIDNPVQIYVLPDGQVVVNEYYNLGFQVFNLNPYVSVNLQFEHKGNQEIVVQAKNYNSMTQQHLFPEIHKDPSRGMPALFWVVLSVGLSIGVGLVVHQYLKRRNDERFRSSRQPVNQSEQTLVEI